MIEAIRHFISNQKLYRALLRHDRRGGRGQNGTFGLFLPFCHASIVPYRRLYILCFAVHDGAFDLLDQVGNGNATWAGIGAVKDRATAPHTIAAAQDLQAFLRSLVTAIEDKAVRIDNGCWS